MPIGLIVILCVFAVLVSRADIARPNSLLLTETVVTC